MIKVHKSGFIEVETDGSLLVLTEAEYMAARRRGESVEWNKSLAEKRAKKNDFKKRG